MKGNAKRKKFLLSHPLGDLGVTHRVDLIWCYKVVFGLVDTDMNDFFKFNTRTTSRGHRYKLYKERAITGTRSHFLVNVL